MKILELKVMRGPNYWSGYRKKLIVMKLDLEELEEQPTNKVKGFHERLVKLLPSMHSHRCSEKHEGGFFLRVKEGTWMGHVVEHIALELQYLAGMDCGFGRTRSVPDNKGIYNVIFSYEFENAGIYAAEAAVRVARSLVDNTSYDIKADVEALREIKKRESFGPSTQSIINEVEKRNIPYRRISNDSMILLGHGVYQKRIRATMTGATSGLGIDIAGDKEETKRVLRQACVSVPRSLVIWEEDELKDAIQEIGYPFVIKPIDGNHGRGVNTNIKTFEQAAKAFAEAKRISRRVIVESFVQGYDYRLLVVNYQLVAAALRTPAMIVGNGTSTIEQLIDLANSHPERGEGHEKNMTTIKIDDATLGILADRGLTLQSVLSFGELLTLKTTANISTGGTSTDVTDRVHPFNRLLAERVARILNMDICGIDLICLDISKPVDARNGAVIEVNACPGFRMHLSPSCGLPRNVAVPVLDMLFPPGEPSRIPIIAITGTNGKTTTTRLVAHLMANAGYKPGYITTDGIYIQGQLIEEGDCTGARSAEVVLSDPTVDVAVLECARGGIIRSGLGFDFCNVSIVTNVTADHLGLKDIYTLEDMARVKAVVPQSTCPDGYAILNADDDLVYNMRQGLECKVALFSTDPCNERLLEHCDKGGTAVTVEEGYFTFIEGRWRTRVELIENVPLCLGGKATCMIKNVLPAILAAKIQGLTLAQIRAALHSFIPSPAITPGRFNIFKFRDFEIMVDYAHNTDGFVELKKFLNQVHASSTIGIIAAVGDRRDEDIRNIGALAAEMFDMIIIRHDRDLRGKTEEELERLLTEGIQSADPGMKPEVIHHEIDALKHAMDIAEKGSFIVICTEEIKPTLEFLTELKDQEQRGKGIVDFTLLRAS